MMNIVVKKAFVSSASHCPRQIIHTNNIAQINDDISALIKITFIPNIVVIVEVDRIIIEYGSCCHQLPNREHIRV